MNVVVDAGCCHERQPCWSSQLLKLFVDLHLSVLKRASSFSVSIMQGCMLVAKQLIQNECETLFQLSTYYFAVVVISSLYRERQLSLYWITAILTEGEATFKISCSNVKTLHG